MNRKIFSLKGKSNRMFKPVYLSAFFFLLIYSLLSLVNHYYFRTYAFDLGIRNNAMFDYLHGHWNQATVMYPFKYFDNVLGDHFCLLPIFFAPFSWIAGSYTLLIIQILSVVWGGIGVYFLVAGLSNSKQLPVLAQLHFYLMWGVFSALSFDYHDNVIAAMLVPWYAYHLLKNENKAALIYLIIILISKENMALWMIFISSGFAVYAYKNIPVRRMSLIHAGVSALSFLLIMKVLMPLAGNGQDYQHNSFSVLGDGPMDILKSAVLHPGKMFSLLFEVPDVAKYGDFIGIKAELHFFILAAGGIALIFRPQFLWMLLPVFGQKLFNDDFVKWGVLGHYSIEFVPILTIALYVWVSSFQKQKWILALAWIFLITNFLNTFSMLDRPTTSRYYLVSQLRLYHAKHYSREFEPQEAHKVLKMIPDDAAISANHVFVPRLAFRETIYTYPYIGKDTEYILLLKNSNDVYPLSRVESDAKLKALIENPDWTIQYESADLILFQNKLITSESALSAPE